MASEQLQEANQIDQFKCPMTRIFHSTMHPRYSCHHPRSFLAEQCKSGTARVVMHPIAANLDTIPSAETLQHH